MPNRYERNSDSNSKKYNHLLAIALRQKLNNGYSCDDFYSDLLAGLVVALIAIPLAMALAIASGVAPQHGLYTVIVGGAVVALLGGHVYKLQVRRLHLSLFFFLSYRIMALAAYCFQGFLRASFYWY